MTEHRWSGWPGAWCLDCGIADPREECLIECDVIEYAFLQNETHIAPCPNHPITDCPEPHSNRYNPYSIKD